VKAAVYARFGPPDVVHIAEAEKPVPGDHEVLIKIRAASVNPLDWRFIRGTPYLGRLMFGLRKPKITRLGVDVAGEVESVGKNVTEFKPGDAVFGSCRGAFAEYACTSESNVAAKPSIVTFEQAAAVSVAGRSALQGLRDKGKLQAGQKVLINGAAGGVGTFAVQIAKVMGAEVTGVCSTRNVEMVRSIGADRVIDYMCEDFSARPERYDVILDCVGNHSLLAYKRILNDKGKLIVIGGEGGKWIGPFARALRAIILSRFVSQEMLMYLARPSKRDLMTLSELMTSRKLTPVIDRRYKLNEVAEAIGYVEAGHARGKVIVMVQ
jgi:NADPH:quinone reductase-like Zn-dependent oxidoreductase